MTMDLIDSLDVALEQLHVGEPLPDVLDRHPAQIEALTPLLDAATTLEAIRPVEMPTAQTLLADRDNFLAEITHFEHQAVSPGPLVRLKGWIAHQTPWQVPSLVIPRKEQRRMSALLIKATLIISMAFGSAGGAAALAANSLPESPLYPAKLAMEQTRLSATTDPADKATLHLELTQVRVREMERLALAGEVPDEPIILRLRTHLSQAFHLAAELPDDAMLDTLTQAQQTIQNQERTLEQVQTHAAEPAQESLRQATRMLNQARQEAEAGLQDPHTFRWRHTENRPPEAPPQPAMVPSPGGDSECPEGGCEPVGDQHQHGPQPNQPGLGAPGGNPDCPLGDCEPDGDQHQYGPQAEQPSPDAPGGDTDCPSEGGCDRDRDRDKDQDQIRPHSGPDPGTPAGNPECISDDCEPDGDQNQYGPQPDQPGPGTPGGNPDCSAGDCEPVGDEHHNGLPPGLLTGNTGDDTPPSGPSGPADQGDSPGDSSDVGDHRGKGDSKKH